MNEIAAMLRDESVPATIAADMLEEMGFVHLPNRLREHTDRFTRDYWADALSDPERTVEETGVRKANAWTNNSSWLAYFELCDYFVAREGTK